MWKRGYLLDTPAVREMSREERDKTEAGERMTIFSSFTPVDFGHSRRVVCHLNPLHMEYEKNVALIELAPELLEMFKARCSVYTPENQKKLSDFITKLQTRNLW